MYNADESGPQGTLRLSFEVADRNVKPYGLYALQYASKINAFWIKFCVHIGQIFDIYRAEFKCKMESLICRLIRRLYMQNAVVFNIYCTQISRIFSTNLVHTIEAAERLDIWLNLTNLNILYVISKSAAQPAYMRLYH